VSGTAWSPLDRVRHVGLERDWAEIYAGAFGSGDRQRLKHGERARVAYAAASAPHFLVVPFLGRSAGPHDIGKRGPRVIAYECHGGVLPDLGGFAHLDFFVAPPDLAWTMIHTHEDFTLGGPYFLRREWLVPPGERRGGR
jgi:hypothetical protein